MLKTSAEIAEGAAAEKESAMYKSQKDQYSSGLMAFFADAFPDVDESTIKIVTNNPIFFFTTKYSVLS